MTSPSEFDDFLAELSGRRQRLLQLVEPDDASRAALIEELTELGEQLIVANEELRTQHEELTAARERLANLAHQRELLVESSTHPYVLTDSRGVVLSVNHAAAELIRQPAARRTPRPIATWFEVADRAQVRSLISRIVSGQATEAQCRATIRRSEGDSVPVQVLATIVKNTPARVELQWELVVEPPAENPGLRLVTDAELAEAVASRSDLAAELAVLAVELAGCCTSEQQLLSTVLEHSRQIVPGTEHAGISLLQRRAAVDPAAWTDELVRTVERHQVESTEGPILTALADRSPVLVTDLATETRWPTFTAEARRLGVGSTLTVELRVGETVLGALSLYASQPAAFGDTASQVASTLAAHAAVALSHFRTEQDLRTGMASRELIGEAIGVLIERRRLTSRQAFQLLVGASQHNNVKLREIARMVVETGQDPAQLRPR